MQHNASAKWDKYWRCHEAPDYVNHVPNIIETVEKHLDLHHCQILEVGAGTGGNSATLASRGALVTALDLSQAALDRTVATRSSTGVTLNVVQGDAWFLPFESRSFDLVLHQGFLEHFASPDGLLQEQRRVLRDNGHILVDVPQRYNWYTVYKHRLIRADQWPYGGWEREFSYPGLCTLLESNGFRVVDAYGRGYYPRVWRKLRNLSRIEEKLSGFNVLPATVWNHHDAFWEWFEGTRLGCNTLQCVGVIAMVASDT